MITIVTQFYSQSIDYSKNFTKRISTNKYNILEGKMSLYFASIFRHVINTKTHPNERLKQAY